MAHQILTLLSVSEELYCKLGDWPEKQKVQNAMGFVLNSKRIFLKLFCETRESEGKLSARRNVTLLPNFATNTAFGVGKT